MALRVITGGDMATITRSQVENAVAALGTTNLVDAMAECYVAYSDGLAVSARERLHGSDVAMALMARMYAHAPCRWPPARAFLPLAFQ